VLVALRLLTHQQPEAALHAVCAGGLALWTGSQRSARQIEPFRSQLITVLQRHDGLPCAHAALRAVRRSARVRGLVCGLEGCGRRTRAPRESGKKLQRCGGCRALAYCETAHQHADRARATRRSAAPSRRSASRATQQQAVQARTSEGTEE
jgi:hypothetical protein